jgi:hypothetical protein
VVVLAVAAVSAAAVLVVAAPAETGDSKVINQD